MSNRLDFIYDSEIFIDLYSILNVDMEAKSDEIRTAYLQMVKEHHPDHGGNSEMFQQITKAYEILHNKETRKEYDLYYLKKSMDEFRGDDLNRLKSDYKNFIDANTKPVSKEKLDEIYADMFKDRENYVEKKLEKDDLKKRFNDLDFERKTENIETQDDKLLSMINEINKNSDIPVTVNDFFEYLKYKNNSNSNNTKEIIVGELGTLDTLPGYSSNYTSFVSETEYFGSNLYSDIGMGGDENNDITTGINEINIDEFNKWKHGKRGDTKLTQNELENYLERRKQEEELIFNEVETNLSNTSKKKEVEKFLKTKHLSEEITNYYDKLHETPETSIKKVKKDKSDKSDKSDKNMGNSTEDILEYMEQVKNEKKTITSNHSGNEETIDLLERSKNEKANNVRKREFK